MHGSCHVCPPWVNSYLELLHRDPSFMALDLPMHSEFRRAILADIFPFCCEDEPGVAPFLHAVQSTLAESP